MMNNDQRFVLNKLLDKYESSVHYSGKATSSRRVLLKCSGRSLPMYVVDDADRRDEFNASMRELEMRGVLHLSWERKDFLLKELWLALECVPQAYALAGRCSKEASVQTVAGLIAESIQKTKDGWIRTYLSQEYEKIAEKKSLHGVWKSEEPLPSFFLRALCGIDSRRGEAVSMRVFSVDLFGDSKYFERSLKKWILPVIREMEPSICDLSEEEIDDRTVLAQAGIIQMPEIFEFCGRAQLHFPEGSVDMAPMRKGACISSDAASDLQGMTLTGVERILFIENKTNYSEYNLNCRKEEELTVYHGGFYSPARGGFFAAVRETAAGIPSFFWGDLDYGGFKMYNRLKQLIPGLRPLNMSKEAYLACIDHGLQKSPDYIKKVKALMEHEEYDEFREVIQLIVSTGKIVEQENMISSCGLGTPKNSK